jgi:hypothetical protein
MYQIWSKMFRCLGGTKVSVQVWDLLYECFVTICFFTVWSCWHLAQPQSWRTIPCRLSTSAYSIYSQLNSVLEAVPPYTTWSRAMWCQGLTCQGLLCFIRSKFTKYFQNVPQLNGHVRSWAVAPFNLSRSTCEWFHTHAFLKWSF